MKYLAIAVVVVALLTACQESLEDRCEREAREFTRKHCPTLINKDIALDSMVFDKESRTVSYCYTLRGEIDDTALIRRSDSRELLLQQLKNATSLKLYKDAGFSFRYTYHSSKVKGTQLFEATFHQSDYN